MQIARRAHRKKAVIGLVAVVLFVTSGSATWYVLSLSNPSSSDSSATTTSVEETKDAAEVKLPVPVTPPKPSFDKTKYSATEPDSLWVVINKQHPFDPIGYTPTDLIEGYGGFVYSTRIHTDLVAMMNAAKAAGITLNLSSAYRSYANQQTLYGNYVAQYGQVTADTISARPGHSEHQTGLTLDIGGVTNPGCNFNVCFGDTIEGKWLAANGHKYGFIVRYTAANGDITGYSPEPWHVRYIGRELAAELQKQEITTLEEFFDITGGKQYVR